MPRAKHLGLREVRTRSHLVSVVSSPEDRKRSCWGRLNPCCPAGDAQTRGALDHPLAASLLSSWEWPCWSRWQNEVLVFVVSVQLLMC